MKKLTKKSLDELAQTLPVIEETKQKTYVGGGDGTSASPFTAHEYEIMLNTNLWQGGFVEGMGYVANDKYVYGDYKSPFTVEQKFYTYPDFIDSLSSGTFYNIIKEILTSSVGVLPPLGVIVSMASYLQDQYDDMMRGVQSELSKMGCTGTSCIDIVYDNTPYVKGSTNIITLSVYDANNGQFLTSRRMNFFGIY